MDKNSEPLDFSLLPDVSDDFPETDDPDEQEIALADAHMQARANALHYIFGQTHPEDWVWAPQPDDPLFVNWPGGAILCFPPQNNRNHWYFVTHGLSQPPMEDDEIPTTLDDYLNWREANDKEEVSGWGIELVISTRDFCDWPFNVLTNLVEYLLFADESQIILPRHRVPLAGPIVSETNSLLTYLLAITSPEYPSSIRLPGGLCELVHLIGVTESEIERARQIERGRGSLVLQSVLEKLGVGCVTDPERACLTTHPQFEQAWSEAESQIEIT